MAAPRASRIAAAVAVALGVAALAAACGEPEPRQAGEPCVAAAECAPGLVCDLAATPPVCAGNLTTDARVIDAAPEDAAVVDAPTDAAIDAPVDAEVDAPPAAAPGP